ncbi:MAG: Pyridoxal phosphate homeostasis protein [Phycisphaerae bacterium]|nr:Pyridoxal phosphate homeostasis protein [Phycisphaerae bacterium]
MNIARPPAAQRLHDNYERLQWRIASACARARRDPADIRLVAVTKYVDLDVVRLALELGLSTLGESRAQELIRRAAMINESCKRRRLLGREANASSQPRWHMIGHLQRNKVRTLLPWVTVIHSVDSLRLAEQISHEARRHQLTVDILLQVNLSSESTKFGMAVGAMQILLEQMQALSGLRIVGLMTMAPYTDDPQQTRPIFARLRELHDELHEQELVGTDFRELSMGMSHDFEVAIEEGATLIRVGSTLFDGLTTTTESAESLPHEA